MVCDGLTISLFACIVSKVHSLPYLSLLLLLQHSTRVFLQCVHWGLNGEAACLTYADCKLKVIKQYRMTMTAPFSVLNTTIHKLQPITKGATAYSTHHYVKPATGTA